jgi:hypothetical protein
LLGGEIETRQAYRETSSGNQINYDNLPDDTIRQAEELIDQLLACIKGAQGKPFASAVLLPQLQKLYREYPALKHSAHRPAINELLVAECERTETALLSEAEVDQWWGD